MNLRSIKGIRIAARLVAMVGTEIGPYRVVRERAERSVGGTVYEARDRTHGRKVALSECPADWSVEEILQTLEENARAFTSIEHPNIERVIGFVRRSQAVYLVTELVEGTTLQQILVERGRVPAPMVFPLFRQIMGGLAAAHRAGVVHGDLNPAHVTIPDYGPVKILNMAFTHAFRPQTSRGGNRYRAPERSGGQSPDSRADIFSAGVMLYEAIVGQGPFDAYGEFPDNAAAVRFVPMPPSMAQADIPKWVDKLIARMIAHDPADRFSAAQAVRFLDSHCKAPGEAAEPSDGERSKRMPRENAVKHGKQLDDRSAVTGRAPQPPAKPKRPLASVAARQAGGVAAILLLVATEIFYFQGAHVAALMEFRRASRPSLNESVDAMYARLASSEQTVDRPVISPKRQVIGPKHPEAIQSEARQEKPVASRKAQLPSGNGSAAEKLSAPLAGAQIREERRIESDLAPPEKPVKTKEPEPALPVWTAQNSSAAQRLKVEWEN